MDRFLQLVIVTSEETRIGARKRIVMPEAITGALLASMWITSYDPNPGIKRGPGSLLGALLPDEDQFS